MPIKKKTNPKNTIKEKKTRRITKLESPKASNTSNTSKNLKQIREDKMFEKVEKYVDKNREKTALEMQERKSKRPNRKYQEWDLEIMISRITTNSKPKRKAQEISKKIIYLIYIILIILILIFAIKYFSLWKVSQIL